MELNRDNLAKPAKFIPRGSRCFFWFRLVADVLSVLVVLLPSAELLQLPLLVQVPAPPSTHAPSPQRASFPLPYHSQLQLKLSACLNSLPLLVQTSFGFVFVSDRFFFPPSIPSAATLQCTKCGDVHCVLLQAATTAFSASQSRARFRQSALLVCLSFCLWSRTAVIS